MFKHLGWLSMYDVAIAPFNGAPITARSLVVILLAGLPLYLLLNLGARVLGVPALWRSLTRWDAPDPVKVVTAIFVVAGVVISLLTRFVQAGAVPQAALYNNAVWFFVASKQLLWPFALEALWRWKQGRTTVAAAAAIAAFVLLTMPSYVQFVGQLRRIQGSTMGAHAMALTDFLRDTCEPGDVVFVAAPDTAKAIVMQTRCRVPYLAMYELMRADQLAARGNDLQRFWGAWNSGTIDRDILTRYRARFLVVSRPGAIPGTLAVRFTNEEFTVLDVGR
jgi:hypothetical protein